LSLHYQKIKRGNASKKTVDDFIEHKLIQQGQVLEYLVKMLQKNEEVTNKLLENLSRNVAKPKLPEKVEAYKINHFPDDEEPNPFVRMSKNLPKYGSLLKDVFVNEVKPNHDPIPLVEVPENKNSKVRAL
jgi:hypothetical protein